MSVHGEKKKSLRWNGRIWAQEGISVCGHPAAIFIYLPAVFLAPSAGLFLPCDLQPSLWQRSKSGWWRFDLRVAIQIACNWNCFLQARCCFNMRVSHGNLGSEYLHRAMTLESCRLTPSKSEGSTSSFASCTALLRLSSSRLSLWALFSWGRGKKCFENLSHTRTHTRTDVCAVEYKGSASWKV